MRMILLLLKKRRIIRDNCLNHDFPDLNDCPDFKIANQVNQINHINPGSDKLKIDNLKY